MVSSNSLERLWAPWRRTFLSKPSGGRCFFCVAARAKGAERRYQVIFRDGPVFALLNRYPYNNGHVMVAPIRHVGQLERLTDAEWLGLLRAARRLVTQLRRRLNAQGFNVGANLGRVAGAGVPGHLHLHVVPRWKGDTNFMPILSHTKVISQSLDELYTMLASAGAR